MRILHVDETFHPAFGYQCNPLAKFQRMQGHEVIILTVKKSISTRFTKHLVRQGSI